jgi:hypothetical protein
MGVGRMQATCMFVIEAGFAAYKHFPQGPFVFIILLCHYLVSYF